MQSQIHLTHMYTQREHVYAQIYVNTHMNTHVDTHTHAHTHTHTHIHSFQKAHVGSCVQLTNTQDIRNNILAVISQSLYSLMWQEGIKNSLPSLSHLQWVNITAHHRHYKDHTWLMLSSPPATTMAASPHLIAW